MARKAPKPEVERSPEAQARIAANEPVRRAALKAIRAAMRKMKRAKS